MINLLPPEEKNRLKEEKIRKVVAINLILVLFFLCFIVAGLICVDMYIGEKVNSKANILAEIEKNYQDAGLKDSKKEITKFNGELERLKNFYSEKKYVVDILEKISKLIDGNEIYIKNFYYSIVFRDKAPQYNIAISGHATNREILFNFKKELEKEPTFSEIKFPQENWVKPIDINFEVNMLVK